MGKVASGSRFVYLIAGGGKTKIGLAGDPLSRLAALQANSPVPLRLLGAVEGTAYGEKLLHVFFASRRAHGEWFEGEFTDDEVKVGLQVVTSHTRLLGRERSVLLHERKWRPKWSPAQYAEHDRVGAWLRANDGDEVQRLKARFKAVRSDEEYALVLNDARSLMQLKLVETD